MKTTLDIPDTIYRRVKAKSAIEGRAVRDVAITLFTTWVDKNDLDQPNSDKKTDSAKKQPPPPWFASLHKYSNNARGDYDMPAIRSSIARGRRNKALV